MVMKWNNSRVFFQEHNEGMRGFRRSHASGATVNAPRCEESFLLEKTRPLKFNHIIAETGGASFVGGLTDWSGFVPALRVARYKLSLN